MCTLLISLHFLSLLPKGSLWREKEVQGDKQKTKKGIGDRRRNTFLVFKSYLLKNIKPFFV
jgi:hypothetical protein